MKGANDYTLECDFQKCEQKFRCDRIDGAPQKKTCVWVNATCRDDQTAQSCRTKNTKKQEAGKWMILNGRTKEGKEEVEEEPGT